jgi:hypothetical protein
MMPSVQVLEKCGFSWEWREDDSTFQVSHTPSVSLTVCQKCDTLRHSVAFWDECSVRDRLCTCSVVCFSNISMTPATAVFDGYV